MKYLLMFLLAALLPLSAQSDSNAAVEKEIRENVMKFNGSYAENDLGSYFSFYAEDSMLIVGGSRVILADYHKGWHEFIAGGGGVEKNEITDIQVQVLSGGEVAIANYLIEARSRSIEGEVSKESAIETDVWQKRDGVWKIVSMHYTSRPKEQEAKEEAKKETMKEVQAPTATSPVRLDPDKIAGVGLSAEELFIPPEAILEGSHRPRGDVLFQGEELTMEIYEDDPATFAINQPFPIDEYVLVLSGKLILTDTGGQVHEFVAGDSLVVPKGFMGTWQMLGNYRELIAVRTATYEGGSSTGED
ncbi:MAG: DUF861 domain-containing protein [Proteobacteria bacterium]|jgi:uncharacterized cupin superfamily protein/ketosteroid isomerase-like protein|nr:DUF861 domain-containing protein [Pseudomonadota bacterium]